MAAKKIKIGIIGCGTIGATLARIIERKFSQQVRLVAICDQDIQRARELRKRFAAHPAILRQGDLIEAADLIIEAASAEAAFKIAQQSLQHRKKVLIMSVGGILNRYRYLLSLARSSGGQIFLPSGAIAGLDAVKAAAIAKIKQASLTTRKPIQGLAGAPYLLKKKINLAKIKRETVIFEGPAAEAIKGFPKNINVCATLSLAGIGPKKTKVKIVTSPDYKSNVHEISLTGDFGKLYTRTENVPSPNNPKTSFLATLSASATLKSILDPIKKGT